MVYLDTSVIIKLYVKEKYSIKVETKIKRNDESIPLTSFHQVEFVNALNLKRYRKEISAEEVQTVLARFDRHESIGVYYRPSVNWSDIFQKAIELSLTHTSKAGSRSLDILHVATAVSLKADRFFSFDERQSKLASLSGLEIETV